MDKDQKKMYGQRGRMNTADILPPEGHPNEDTALWVIELRRRMGLNRERFGLAAKAILRDVIDWERGFKRPTEPSVRQTLAAHGRKVGMPKLPPATSPEKPTLGPVFDPAIERRFAAFYHQEGGA